MRRAGEGKKQVPHTAKIRRVRDDSGEKSEERSPSARSPGLRPPLRNSDRRKADRGEDALAMQKDMSGTGVTPMM